MVDAQHTMDLLAQVAAQVGRLRDERTRLVATMLRIEQAAEAGDADQVLELVRTAIVAAEVQR